MFKNILSLPIKKFMHAGIVVRDVEQVVTRLESLGIGPTMPIPFPPIIGTPLFRGKPSDIKVKCIMVQMGNIELELIQPVRGESPYQEYLDSKGEGINHVAYMTDDLAGAIAQHTEKGGRVLLQGKWRGGGFAYFDFGTGDIVIEFYQL